MAKKFQLGNKVEGWPILMEIAYNVSIQGKENIQFYMQMHKEIFAVIRTHLSI